MKKNNIQVDNTYLVNYVLPKSPYRPVLYKEREAFLSEQKKQTVPEIAAKISNNVWMFTVFHHNDFLLHNSKIFS